MIVDWKTDDVSAETFPAARRDLCRGQVDMYAEAWQSLTGGLVKEQTISFPREMDGGSLYHFSTRRRVRPERLLRRLAKGALSNVRFEDFRSLVEVVGFQLSRVSGSHYIFIHPESREILSLQSAGGEAKPYQIRQFLRLVERYDLKIGDR